MSTPVIGQITDRPIEGLIPYARNARTHSDAQVAQIAASIREFGFTNPVLVDGANGIIAGHGRVLAARKLGLTTVPCIELSHLNETQRRAYILADNKLALNAGWDEELLGLELQQLQADDFDVSLAGFGAEELAALLADKTEGLTDPDEVPEAPTEPATVLGDVWVLGRHRVMCGDSTSFDAVERLMCGEKPAAVITDPPYNVDINYGESSTDSKTVADYEDFTRSWFHIARTISDQVLLTPGTGRGLGMPNLHLWFEIQKPGWILIWVKKNTVGHSSLGGFNAWEPIYFYGKPKKKIGQDIYDIPLTVQSDVADKDGNKLHPTPKQVKLWAAMVEDFTDAGDLLFEPFSGSGTTLVACEKTGRRCYALELEPKYCDVAVRRWQNFTGQQATLEADGRTFDEIAASRGPPN